MSIRQQNDSPPDYNTAVEDSILPVIPKSNKIYPIVQPVQYNSLTINSDFPQDINQPNVNYPRHNIQQSGANNNIGFRPLPPLVVPSQSSINNSSAKRQKPPTFSKPIIFLIIVGGVIVCAAVGVGIYFIYVEVAKKFMSPVCNDGYSILDCSTECGISSVDTTYQRIVGGSVAAAHSWPAMALVIFSFSGTVQINGLNYRVNTSSMCGGTLIAKTSVLTAAHCVKTSFKYTLSGRTYTYNFETSDDLPSYYTIYLGAQNINNLDDSSIIKAKVNRITKHENYDSENTLNDIAVFNLKTEVTLSNLVQVACFPNSLSSTYPSSMSNTRAAYGVGWGTTSSGGDISSNLKDVDLVVYDSNLCSGVAASSKKNWDSQICAGYWQGGKDTCQGDSGGPLYIRTDIGGKQKYVTVGITSYGVGCGDAHYPAIYTRNSYFYDWVRKNKASKLSVNFCITVFWVIFLFLKSNSD